MQEDGFFLEAASVGHRSQPSRIEKGQKIMSWRNYSTLKKNWGKSLMSIISRISLRVTQHHRGKEMASFHEGWKKGGG